MLTRAASSPSKPRVQIVRWVFHGSHGGKLPIKINHQKIYMEKTCDFDSWECISHIGSMDGIFRSIFTYIWVFCLVNLGKYTINQCMDPMGTCGIPMFPYLTSGCYWLVVVSNICCFHPPYLFRKKNKLKF